MSAKIIELRLTTGEAHMLLRALGVHSTMGDKQDRNPARWVAERLLRILAPDLGPRPIEALEALEDSAARADDE